MPQIRITPEELREAASLIENKLEAIRNEVEEIHSRITDVADNWEGASQSSFIETFEGDMYPILRDTVPQVMEGLSAQLTGAADALEQADEEVAKAFKG